MPDNPYAYLGHLVPRDIEADFDGYTYVIAAMSALQWLTILAPDSLDPYDIFPVLAGQEAIEAVENQLWDGSLDMAALAPIGLDVITAAGDRPWWETLRYLAVLKGSWSTIGASILISGIDVNKASLAGFVDVVKATCLRYCDPKDLTMWQAKIETPPKGMETEVDFTAEERAFMAAMKGAM